MHTQRAVLATVVAALAATTACLRAQGWVRHNDPLGFTVQHPAGWKVETDAAGLIRVGAADRSAFILVQPFLLPRPTTARQWVQQAPAALAGAFPESRVTRVEQRGARPDQVLASLAYAPAGQATLLCLIDGKAGMVYAIAAPQAQFAARRPELVRILRTFSFTQPAARTRPSGPALQYVRWSDPRENAFSIEAPAKWRVSGGMSRFAPVDTRAAVDLTSPDGQVHVMFGDAALPTHTEPTQTLAMAGFREGSWYSPGYGVRMMVRRYVPGMYFAAEYAQRRIGAQCTGLTLVDRRDRPDLAAQLGRIYVQTGYVSQQLTTGEVSFTCSAGGAPMRGYYFAGTLRVLVGGASGIWQVPHLVGWLAPPDRVSEAQAVLQHVIATAQINPDWARMQQGITAKSSEIVSRTHAEITRILDDTYWNRQRSQDNLSRQWSNVILGQTDVRDPATGETWKVASGHNYYWRQENTNGIAGTDTYTRPDIDFTPLVEW